MKMLNPWHADVTPGCCQDRVDGARNLECVSVSTSNIIKHSPMIHNDSKIFFNPSWKWAPMTKKNELNFHFHLFEPFQGGKKSANCGPLHHGVLAVQLDLGTAFRHFVTPQCPRRVHQFYLVGGWPTPLKNISQWEGLSHILWKIKNVPNHQPVMVV